MLEGRKGDETSRAVRSRYTSEGRVVAAARGGGGEKRSSLSTSMSRIAERASGLSQGGGKMFARRWRLSSKASHRGSGVGNGGVSALVGPYLLSIDVSVVLTGELVTPSSSSESRRWRGITVTISISHRKATSAGVRPGFSGNAMSNACIPHRVLLPL